MIIAIIVTEFPQPGEHAKAMSVYIFVAVGGGSIGLLAGGALTQAIDWHWIFFINLPIGAASLCSARVLEESEAPGSPGRRLLGSVLVTAAMMLGVYAIVTTGDDGWGSARTLGFGGAALLLMAAFASRARHREPDPAPRIPRLRSLAGASIVRGLLVVRHVLGVLPRRALPRACARLQRAATGLAFLPMTLTSACSRSGSRRA